MMGNSLSAVLIGNDAGYPVSWLAEGRVYSAWKPVTFPLRRALSGVVFEGPLSDGPILDQPSGLGC